ncbi:MAG: BtpA/SgcQ family protein, partial [Gemmatimonadetes bacterium]|nr:BtpA/SgcQ family protein [Gemmatimonadota bacterium]
MRKVDGRLSGEAERFGKARDREKRHEALWGSGRPVVGMVHLPPLPGAPGFTGTVEEISSRAAEEATVLTRAGFDGVLVENYGDTPFYPADVPPETVSALAVVVRAVVQETTVPVGVNVLRNDSLSALGIAVATGAGFIRVNVHTGSMFTDQGLLQGRAHETIRKRAALGADVSILADVLVKHATPPPGVDLDSAARDTWLRGGPDGLILTGTETGAPVDPESIRGVRETLPADAKV